MATTAEADGQGQRMDFVSTQAHAFDLEAQEARADGTIPIQVTLAAIQVKTETPDRTLGEYDSTQPESEGNSMAGIYVPFIGKRFTISVSAQGEITDPGLDELFLAAAIDRVAAEDDMTREQLKEQAEEAIERTNQRFGSRQGRVMDLKKQLEEFFFSAGVVRSLLGHVITALPADPVQPGTRWDGPVAVWIGGNLEIPGTYEVIAIEDDFCNITADAQRSLDAEPFIYQTGPTVVTNKLGGSSQLSLTVDRQTGWLRAKEQTTTLSGRVMRVSVVTPGQESFSDVSMEITTTVRPVD
jgi:hypothetical protein